MPWFPFYVDDFMASPKVARMSMEEVGVYLFLLCQQHQDGAVEWPCERIPHALRGHDSSIEYVLSECFKETKDGWKNPRLAQIHAEQAAKSKQASRAAKARWENASNADAHADAKRAQSGRYANQNQNQKQRDSGDKSPSSTATAVFSFLERTGSEWRLKDKSVREWVREIESDPKYDGADIEHEVGKAADWHVGQGVNPKAPDMALRNWVAKAAKDAQEKRKKNGTPMGLDRPLPRLRDVV